MHFLCSGHMLNCTFGLNHHPPEQIFIMTPTEIITVEEFMAKLDNSKRDEKIYQLHLSHPNIYLSEIAERFGLTSTGVAAIIRKVKARKAEEAKEKTS